MKTSERRYLAPRLRAVIEGQHRYKVWVAGEAGISPALLTRVMKGERTIGEAAARRVAAVLQVPFELLFELPVGSDTIPEIRDADRVA